MRAWVISEINRLLDTVYELSDDDTFVRVVSKDFYDETHIYLMIKDSIIIFDVTERSSRVPDFIRFSRLDLKNNKELFYDIVNVSAYPKGQGIKEDSVPSNRLHDYLFKEWLLGMI